MIPLFAVFLQVVVFYFQTFPLTEYQVTFYLVKHYLKNHFSVVLIEYYSLMYQYNLNQNLQILKRYLLLQQVLQVVQYRFLVLF